MMNSSELKGYLTGLILGDGYIGKGITKRIFSIKSINKEFIDKIQSDLESCTNFKINIRYIPEHYSCGCNHKDSWELTIKSHPYFAKKYHHFYNDNSKRRISKEALNWLTPQGIANWYMSDGYVCLVGKTKGIIKNRRIDFCTDRYDKETIQRISKMFIDRFEIENSLVKRRNTYRIRIRQSSYNRFITMVYPYIVKSFKYKLFLGYENKPYWMDENVWLIQEEVKKCDSP